MAEQRTRTNDGPGGRLLQNRFKCIFQSLLWDLNAIDDHRRRRPRPYPEPFGLKQPHRGDGGHRPTHCSPKLSGKAYSVRVREWSYGALAFHLLPRPRLHAHAQGVSLRIGKGRGGTASAVTLAALGI